MGRTEAILLGDRGDQVRERLPASVHFESAPGSTHGKMRYGNIMS